MSGKKSRTKGAVGELDVCKMLSQLYPDAARELEQYQGELGRDLRETQPLCVQVKRHKSLTDGEIFKAFSEAKSAVDEEYKFPVVFYREDFKSWRVATTMEVILAVMDSPSDMADEELMLDMSAEQFVRWLQAEFD